MNCIYCNSPITGRKKGDHIISQGLGKFSPEFTVLCICKNCDSKNGSGFERIALRTGIIGAFRAIKGIKSHNNKRLPPHSPSLDKFNVLESQQFAIANISSPNETVYVADRAVRFSNTIVIKKNGVLIDTIDIPATRDIREICNFIEAKIPERLDGLECELHIHKEQMKAVSKELTRRGKKLEDIGMIKREPEFQLLQFSTILTDNHIRFVVSTVVKGMIFLGYSADLLRPMIEYVKTGNPQNLLYRGIDQRESGMDTFDDPPLSLFYHSFQWEITGNSIAIAASLLAHKNVNGIRVKVSAKAGNDNSIVIPYGKIIARYGDTPNEGRVEIFHGDHKIEE